MAKRTTERERDERTERNGRKSGKTPDRNPFLKPEDLGRGISKLEIGDEVRAFNGKYGAQLFIEVEYDGKTYDWPLKIGSANHVAIDQKLGRNICKWPGERLSVEVVSFIGRNDEPVKYIAIEGSNEQRD